jgi:hypothetical protein
MDNPARDDFYRQLGRLARSEGATVEVCPFLNRPGNLARSMRECWMQGFEGYDAEPQP